jgi:spore coat protein CotF
VFLQFLLGKASQVAQSQKGEVYMCQQRNQRFSEIQPTNILSILKVLSAKGQQSSSLLNFNSYPNEN